MADRRMISLKIVDTDKFVEMPVSTRLLYYELCVRADDDGFVSSPQKIIRMVGCSNDDMKLLTAKNYIIPFETGVCVVKDWKIHNTIQKDRYKRTIYQEEFLLLSTKENNEYILDPDRIQVGSSLDPDRIPKLDQVNLNQNNIKENKVADKPVKKNFRGFDNVFLTDDEYEEIAFSYGGVATYHIIKKLSNWKLAQNKTTHSDYGAIESWVVKAVKEEKAQLFVYPSQDDRLARAARKKMEKEKCLSSQ